MTYPPNNDPYGNQQPPPYGQQPQQPYGQPQQPPTYRQQPPQYGAQQPYGAQPQYGAPQYGAPQAPYGGPAVAGNLASWIQRVGAYIIDALVVAPFSILALTLGHSTDSNGLPSFNALYFVFWLLGILVSGYNRWYQQGTTGQSWGKKVLGLRLIGE